MEERDRRTTERLKAQAAEERTEFARAARAAKKEQEDRDHEARERERMRELEDKRRAQQGKEPRPPSAPLPSDEDPLDAFQDEEFFDEIKIQPYVKTRADRIREERNRIHREIAEQEKYHNNPFEFMKDTKNIYHPSHFPGFQKDYPTMVVRYFKKGYQDDDLEHLWNQYRMTMRHRMAPSPPKKKGLFGWGKWGL
jgi:hypothetical protein